MADIEECRYETTGNRTHDKIVSSYCKKLQLK